MISTEYLARAKSPAGSVSVGPYSDRELVMSEFLSRYPDLKSTLLSRRVTPWEPVTRLMSRPTGTWQEHKGSR